MHGAGNCFVLINDMERGIAEEQMSSLAVNLCGKEKVDGLIIVLPPEDADSDFRMMFFNSDGSIGEMCGNGARCVARFGYEQGIAKDPQNIRIMTTAGLVTGRKITDNLYEVRLNDPSVADIHREVEANGKVYDCSYVELGRPGIPHAVVEIPIEEIKDCDSLRELGRALRYSSEFSKGANVTFCAFTDESSVKAITFERGVEDFTLACGTGCGATAVTMALRNRLPGSYIIVDMPGGELKVTFSRQGTAIYNILLTGPTAYME